MLPDGRRTLRRGGLGRLALTELTTSQGSLGPRKGLGAWRGIVGHEGGLEHVGGNSRLRGNGQRGEVDIPTVPR